MRASGCERPSTPDRDPIPIETLHPISNILALRWPRGNDNLAGCNEEKIVIAPADANANEIAVEGPLGADNAFREGSHVDGIKSSCSV